MKQFFKDKLPTLSEISKIKVLQKLNITHRSLWCFSRKNISPAFFIGLFCAMLPMPFQMLPATILAIYFRANLPISLALVWTTNPITIPFIFYFNYRIGVFLLGLKTIQITDFHSWQSILAIMNPLVLGSVISGLFFGLLGYVLVNWTYILIIRNSQNKRKWRKHPGKIKSYHETTKNKKV